MSIRLVACPHPFRSERIEREIEPKAIKDIITEIQPFPELQSARVLINDEVVPADQYDRIPPDGSTLIVRMIPMDKSQTSTGMKVLGGFLAVLGAAITIFSGGALAWLGIPLIGVGAEIYLGGAALQFGWFLPKVNINRDNNTPDPSIRGSRNQANPRGDIPIILGKHLITPPFGAAPYTMVQGRDQYLHELFVLGYGPLDIDLTSLRIGETLLSNFSSVDTDSKQNADPIALFPGVVTEDQPNLQLKTADGPIVRTSHETTSQIIVELTFPNGLVKFDDSGNKGNQSVEVRAEYKPTGSPDASYVVFGDQNVQGSDTRTIRIAFSKDLPLGQYDVRMSRVTGDTNDTKIIDGVYWTSFKSVEHVDPVGLAIRDKLVRFALRIKATDQVNGIVDQFNLVVQSIAPDYDGSGSGSGAWSARATSNPASLLLLLLRGPMNPNPVPDDRIDWPALEAWHTWCATNGHECNAVEANGETLKVLLGKVCTTGRASLTIRDGKYSIVQDIEKLVPVQHFTPRNSWGFSGQKSFAKPTQAVRLSFINREVGWQTDERTVYDDGYDASTATAIQEIDLWGFTDPAQVWKHGRYLIASARLRPEIYSLNTDVENLVCTRGDLVRVSHDVALFGITAGKIKAVVTDASGNVIQIVSDEALPMEAGKTYGIRIRHNNGSSTTHDVVTVDGSQNVLTLATPIPAGSAPEPDNMFSFGLSGQETAEMLVYSIEMQDDLSARLLLVDAAPGVWAADQGAIPPYDSQVTLPADIPYTPPTPVIEDIRSDGTVLVKQSDGSWQNRIYLKLYPVANNTALVSYEIQYKINGTDDEWQGFTIPANATEAYIAPVESGLTYAVRVRSFKIDGIPSAWANATILVQGKEAPPQNILNLTAVFRALVGIDLVWSPVGDLDLAEYEIREGSDWATGTIIWHGLATSYTWPMLDAGTYHLMLKAVDTSGNYSITERVADVTVTSGLQTGEEGILGKSENWRTIVASTYFAIQKLISGLWTNRLVTGGLPEDPRYDIFRGAGLANVAADLSQLIQGDPKPTGAKVYHFDGAYTDDSGADPWDDKGVDYLGQTRLSFADAGLYGKALTGSGARLIDQAGLGIGYGLSWAVDLWEKIGGGRQRLLTLDNRRPLTSDPALGLFADGAGNLSLKAVTNLLQQGVVPATSILNARYGHAVAVSGDGLTIAVGTYPCAYPGTVRILTTPGPIPDGNHAWTEEANLTSSDGVVGDYFGTVCALSYDGSVLVVGAAQKDSQKGKVYIYRRDGSSWIESGITASDGAVGDVFGFAVDISADGNTIIVGAPGATGNVNKAYLYKWNGSAWVESAIQPDYPLIAGDWFGDYVAVNQDGTALVVAAYRSNSGAGRIFVFTWTGSTWNKEMISASDSSSNAWFGCSVDMAADGKTIVVGSNQVGKVYVYRKGPTIWSEQKIIKAYSFGDTVRISDSGDTILTGNRSEVTNTGKAYLYRWDGTTWVETVITASDGATNDYFGLYVGMSSDASVLAISAYNKTIGGVTSAGKLYIEAPASAQQVNLAAVTGWNHIAICYESASHVLTLVVGQNSQTLTLTIPGTLTTPYALALLFPGGEETDDLMALVGASFTGNQAKVHELAGVPWAGVSDLQANDLPLVPGPGGKVRADSHGSGLVSVLRNGVEFGDSNTNSTFGVPIPAQGQWGGAIQITGYFGVPVGAIRVRLSLNLHVLCQQGGSTVAVSIALGAGPGTTPTDNTPHARIRTSFWINAGTGVTFLDRDKEVVASLDASGRIYPYCIQNLNAAGISLTATVLGYE